MDDPLPHALVIYAGRSDEHPVAEPDYPGFSGATLLRVSLDGLLAASEVAAEAVKTRGAELVAILGLLEHLLAKVNTARKQAVPLRWQPEAWLATMACVAQTVRPGRA